MSRHTAVCLCSALYTVLCACVILQRFNGHIQFFFHNYYSATIYTDIFEKSVNAESGLYESYHHYGQAGIYANRKSIFEHDVEMQPKKLPATVFKCLAGTELSCASKKRVFEFACNIREIDNKHWLLVLRAPNYGYSREHPVVELKYGFGDPRRKDDSAYFMGFEKLHQLTKRFDMSVLAASQKIAENSQWEHEISTDFHVGSSEAYYNISFAKKAATGVPLSVGSESQNLWSKDAYRDLLKLACAESSWLTSCELYIRPV